VRKRWSYYNDLSDLAAKLANMSCDTTTLHTTATQPWSSARSRPFADLGAELPPPGRSPTTAGERPLVHPGREWHRIGGSVTTEWDVFISHAGEDKETVARPLARLLEKAGVTVWLDEGELTLGDSLRARIDRGITASAYAIVVLSPAF